MKKQTKFGLVLAAAAVISVSVASLVCARGWVQDGADWYYVNNDNEYVTDTIQSSGNAKFYLGEDGKMMRDYFLEDYNENAYYFGSNGAMVTNTWVAVDSSIVENQDDYVPDNYWYYFQASGKAIKGTSERAKKTTIDGKKYAFNEYGQMATGWFGEDGKTINPDDEENPFKDAWYYAGGDNDGVLRAGWLTYYDGYEGDDNPATDYTNLYFYFNTSNNKKYGIGSDGQGEAAYKTINGRKYAFNEEGIMYSGWDVYNNRSEEGWNDSLGEKVTYFSGEDDGHQVKKGWVYTVPAESIDQKKYNDDEQVYMYFASSGDSVRDQFKKINGKWYVFDRKGIMKTGIILWAGAGMAPEAGTSYRYVDKLDTDYAEGADIAKKGILQTDVNHYILVNPDGEVESIDYDGDSGPGMLAAGDVLKLHLHGEDGARKTGANAVEFADDTFTFTSNNNGDKGSGIFAKKYYSLGIQLKANPDIRYGIYTIASYSDTAYAGPFAPQSSDGKELSHFRSNMSRGDYMVLTSGGAKQKGNNGAKKDGDGNYWLIDKQSGTLRLITTVNTHTAKSYTTSWKTKSIRQSALATIKSENYTTQELIDAGLIIEGTEAAGITRTWKPTFEGASVYFQPSGSLEIRSYQSDFGDGANKWIPMGMLDNSNETVTLRYNAVSDAAAHAYEVTPNDDYFLNCFWNRKADDKRQNP